MIKQLITDIAFDNIKLSQAITRAKLVERKIKNEIFKKWLMKELEGYEFNDSYLPEYRKVWSVMNLTAEFPYGRKQTFPVLLGEDWDEQFLDSVNYHRIVEPISIVEEQIKNIEDAKGYINIEPQLVEILAKFYQNQLANTRGVIRSGMREVGRVQYQNVLEQTKQKLLDTLMDLEDEFPNLINDYSMTEENKDKVQNIITNNIYGDNNPLNIAAGHDVIQKDINNIFSKGDYSKLKKLGVEDKDITDLKQIVSTNAKDKVSLKDKAMKWLGSVSASIAAKGLYDNIPALTELIHKLTS